VVAVPVAVVKKFGDDEAGNLVDIDYDKQPADPC
jgi:hypothetical protein